MHQSCRGTAATVLTHLAAGCSNLADFPLKTKRDYIKVWLRRRCRCGNTVRWMEGTSCRGHTPSFRHAWRSKGGQVVTLVCRTRSPLLFTPQVYTLQPSWLVVFTCRERHTHTYSIYVHPSCIMFFKKKLQGSWARHLYFWHLPPDWLVVHLAFVWSRQWQHIDHSKHLPPSAECIPEKHCGQHCMLVHIGTHNDINLPGWIIHHLPLRVEWITENDMAAI